MKIWCKIHVIIYPLSHKRKQYFVVVYMTILILRFTTLFKKKVKGIDISHASWIASIQLYVLCKIALLGAHKFPILFFKEKVKKLGMGGVAGGHFSRDYFSWEGCGTLPKNSYIPSQETIRS